METIIPLLISLFGSAISYSLAKNDRNESWKHQEELMKQQNQFNLDAQNMQNQWNSETNQYERRLATGMSPSTAVSGLNSSTLGATSAAGVPSVNGFNPGLMDIFGSKANQMAELMNTKADTALKNAETQRNTATLPYDISKLTSEIHKFEEEIGLTNEQRKNLEIINKYADQKSQEEINSIIESYKKTIQETSLLKEEEKKTAWENFYRENFGIDPHDNVGNMIVTASLKGDMDNVFNAFEKTADYLFNKAGEIFNKIGNKISDRMPSIENTITKYGKDSINKSILPYSTSWYWFKNKLMHDNYPRNNYIFGGRRSRYLQKGKYSWYNPLSRQVRKSTKENNVSKNSYTW